jgi:DNA primase
LRAPDDIVERIRDAVSIVDVVGAHVRLRKRGRNYIGLCPFHTEKTPSFNVLDDKGIYKCFGCGEGGDVFSFVMKLESLTFPEALEKLAAQAGIEYHPKERRPDGEQDKSEALTNACRDYAAFCYKAIRGPAGLSAMEYLKERRFTDETLKRFGVGYAPEGKDSFIATSERSARSLTLYEEAGILIKNNNGEHFDRFHGRVIFPIYSPTGKIIGFGGRIMPNASGQQLAKYVNSPETLLYHKSHILYGLFQAKDAIRKQDYAILVEGYADVLALSQAGFTNVVAASGTSLTTDQLNLLRRYTKQIVLLFDADTAGKNAALRGIELALAADFDVSTVVLPGDDDPDSFIRTKGAAAFAEELERRTSFVETKARLLRESGSFETPEGSARAVRSIVETIAKVSDPIKREFFVRKIAEKFRLMESTLLAELKKIRGSDETRERRLAEREKSITLSRQPEPPPEHVLTSAPLAPPNGAELTLLRSFLENTELAYQSAIEMDFDFGLIEHPAVQEIIRKSITEFESSGASPAISVLLEDFEDDEATRSLIVDAAARRIHISEEWVDAAPTELEIREQIRLAVHQSAAIISKKTLEQHLTTIRERLREPLAEEDAMTLLSESMEVSKRLEDLRAVQARMNF